MQHTKSSNVDWVGLTHDVAGRAAEVAFPALPTEAVEYAKHCCLDWLGVAIAGSSEPLSRILRKQAKSEGPGGNASLVGTAQSTSLLWAALINGAASHALDYDDVLEAMPGHPSVPVFPALLALAEAREADGQACISAFVAGVETEHWIGRLMGSGHYARGFHSTGTLGTFGAAAASAHLLQLDLARWEVALGLAGTQAAGLKCMFGTMAKPLHAGKAAANGLLAARLAADGFTANPNILDAEQGFVSCQTDTFQVPEAQSSEEVLGVTQVLFKYHAACYLTHAGIEAIRKLREERPFTSTDVEVVRLRVPEGHLRVCNIPSPRTGLEGKFSLRFTAALALAGMDTGEHSFTEAIVNDPSLCALRDKVTVTATTELPNDFTTEVEVRLRGGHLLEARADVSQPASSEELSGQWNRLAKKFAALAAPVLGEGRAHHLLALVQRLEQLDDISELLALSRRSE